MKKRNEVVTHSRCNGSLSVFLKGIRCHGDNWNFPILESSNRFIILQNHRLCNHTEKKS